MVELDLMDDINFTDLSVDDDEKRFNLVVGHVEDILMDANFTQLLNKFMEKHWLEFDDSEENKLVYTNIFKEYLETIEKYLEEQLLKKMPNFCMEHFEEDLRHREKNLEGEVFEVLETFTDFCAFKSMFLDYKLMKEGRTADFSLDLNVTKYISETSI